MVHEKNVRWYLGVFVSAQAAAEARAAVDAAALKAASEHARKIRVAECKKKLSEAQAPKKRPKRKNRSHVLSYNMHIMWNETQKKVCTTKRKSTFVCARKKRTIAHAPKRWTN